jgi:acyl carrier protein
VEKGVTSVTEENPQHIVSEVKVIVAALLRVSVDRLDLSTHLANELHADSLDALDIALSVEKVFGIKVPDEAIPRYATVGDIVNGVRECIATQTVAV